MNLVEFIESHFWALWFLIVIVATCLGNIGSKK
jgi:hypothetical protein